MREGVRERDGCREGRNSERGREMDGGRRTKEERERDRVEEGSEGWRAMDLSRGNVPTSQGEVKRRSSRCQVTRLAGCACIKEKGHSGRGSNGGVESRPPFEKRGDDVVLVAGLCACAQALL